MKQIVTEDNGVAATKFACADCKKLHPNPWNALSCQMEHGFGQLRETLDEIDARVDSIEDAILYQTEDEDDEPIDPRDEPRPGTRAH